MMQLLDYLFMTIVDIHTAAGGLSIELDALEGVPAMLRHWVDACEADVRGLLVRTADGIDVVGHDLAGSGNDLAVALDGK